MSVINWIKNKFKRKPLYEHGTCNGSTARRNRKTGEVQMSASWATAGDGWVNFDSSWWPKFIADEKEIL